MTDTTDLSVSQDAGDGPGKLGLRLSEVTKTYPGVIALNRVDFECAQGEVHALVGENGSGKSTLIKVSAGLLTPDSGTVAIADSMLTHQDPRHARRLGLMTAYQDTSLVADLSVEENIELSFHCQGEPAPKDLKKVLARFNLPFGPRESVRSLGPGGRQMLEVARAMIHSPRVLLLDEPTAVLDVPAADKLADLIKRTRDQGCAIVFVSHRLAEVRRLADRLTVIRDGVIQGTHARMDWEVDQIVELMVGTSVDLEFPDRKAKTPADRPLLSVTDLTATRMGPVSLRVDAGEIVGIAGAEGNGQRQLLRALIGLDRKGGTVEVAGRKVPASPAGAVNAGLNLQSGDRVAESVFPTASIVDNATVQLGSEIGPAGFLRGSRMRNQVREAVSSLGIVIASHFQPVGALSGGNQQKVVLSRPSLKRPRVLIVDEPTQGVDAKARLDIYRMLSRTAEQGVGVLVNSSDSFELAGLCDRVYVVADGAIIDEVTGELEESDIVRRFVASTGKREEEVSGAAKSLHKVAAALASPWVPVVALLVMMMALGAYTSSRSDLFLLEFNLNNILLSALPLACVAIGQQFALLVAEFDISIGASMTLAVVIVSFLLSRLTAGSLFVTLLVVLGAAAATGLFNAFVTQVLRVTPLVATIGTLGIVTGLCVLLRPQPAGAISPDLGLKLTSGISFLPYAFIGVVVVALLLDGWLFRSGGGLMARSVGLGTASSERVGVRVRTIKTAGYLAAALGAAIGGFFLSAQVGVGSNDVGLSIALPAFASCFLGGATLTGGRGTFVGAMLGAVFLTVISNSTQLLNMTFAWTQVIYGVILLIAVSVYSIAARRAHG
jgi:ABC-type sugar transport system ATPase subunit/ribose/xylose/arabinose/galactoside ABC-type transport system permease subunit